MKKRVINIGVIGVGWAGRMHTEAYSKLKNVNITMVVDKDLKKVRSFAREYDIRKWSTNYENLVNDGEIDAVDLCTPPFIRKQIVLPVINAGKHISIQKPMALTLEEADEMIVAAQKNNVKLMCSYMFRFSPPTIKMSELIKQGKIGKPAMAFHTMYIPADFISSWYWKKEKSGGMLTEMLIHGFDLFRWYFGEAKTIYARGFDVLGRGSIDNASIIIEFQSGVVANIQGSWTIALKSPNPLRVVVIGDEGSLVMQRSFFGVQNPMILSYASREGDSITTWVNASTGFVEKLDYFVSCIREDKPLDFSGGKDGKAALEMALAANRSIETSSVVSLPLSKNKPREGTLDDEIII